MTIFTKHFKQTDHPHYEYDENGNFLYFVMGRTTEWFDNNGRRFSYYTNFMFGDKMPIIKRRKNGFSITIHDSLNKELHRDIRKAKKMLYAAKPIRK